jgi:hypothetical protein
MPNPMFDPYALAAIREIFDSPASKAMARIAEEHARMIDSPTMRALASAAEEHARMMDSPAMHALATAAEEQVRMIEGSGVLDTMSVAGEQFKALTGASKLADTISALGLADLQHPLLGEDFARYASAFKAANAIDPALLSKFDGLAVSMRQGLDFAPYEHLQKALGPHGALETLANNGSFGGSLLADTSWSHIARDFERLKDAYGGVLLDPVSLRLPLVADLHLPEIDVAAHCGLLRAFEAEDDEVESVAKELSAEVSERTIRQVEAISLRLGAKLRSAFENLGSSDPQAASNACLAIRQVFMALLRKLAPEDRVRPWATLRNDPELFKDRAVGGETSYRARILYLSRFDLDEKSAYSTFLVHNTTSLVSLIRIVNNEIHDESPNDPPLILTAGRVEHLLLRAASAFGELIICANVQRKMDGCKPN